MPADVWTDALADDLITTVAAEEHAILTEKTGTVFDAAAMALDGLRLLGVMGLPTGDQFNHGYATTFLNVVALPARHLDPMVRVVLVMHELTHVRQFYAAPLVMPIRYLTIPEARGGHYEGEAYASGVDLVWAFTGQVPARVGDLAHNLVAGYMLGAGDVALAQGVMEQHATSTVLGVIRAQMARRAIRFVAARAPGLLDPRAVALIRAASPELVDGA